MCVTFRSHIGSRGPSASLPPPPRSMCKRYDDESHAALHALHAGRPGAPVLTLEYGPYYNWS